MVAQRQSEERELLLASLSADNSLDIESRHTQEEEKHAYMQIPWNLDNDPDQEDGIEGNIGSALDQRLHAQALHELRAQARQQTQRYKDEAQVCLCSIFQHTTLLYSPAHVLY
jgi:hypothetical protein